MREHAEKLLQCTRELRSDPTSPDALFTLATIYAAQGHRAKAMKFLRRLELTKPSYPGLEPLKKKIYGLPIAPVYETKVF